MINYVAINESGEIVASGIALDETEAKEDAGGEGEVLVGPQFEGVDSETHYLKKGKICKYPERPSSWHTFNFDKEVWEISDITEARNSALQTVARRTSLKRSEFITDVAGQETSYKRKFLQALAYQRESKPSRNKYNSFKKEANLRGISIPELVSKVIDKGRAWEVASEAIEEARFVANLKIGKAEDLRGIELVLEKHAKALEAIKK